MHRPGDLTELALLYDVTLSNVLEKHAPAATCLVTTKQVAARPQVPWYTNDVRIEKMKRRKSEKHWLRTRAANDWGEYKTVQNVTLQLLNKTRTQHDRDLILENKDNQKKPLIVVKSMLNMSNKQPLIPCTTCIDENEFVNDLGNHFSDKVLKIHKNIETCLDAICEPRNYPPFDTFNKVDILSNFESLSEYEVEELIANPQF